jgi:hydroxyacylglutathione hydrolase
MKINQIFFNNNLRNFSYLIHFDDEAIFCIDPFSAKEITDKLSNLSGIINTHDHCDHHYGNAELVAKFQCPVMCHHEAVVPGKSRGLSDGEVIFQNKIWELSVIYTPGHTLSHLCVLLKKENIPYAIFTGDCFFNAGVGNCYNGGNLQKMYETITKYFMNFPDDLLIYPGHEYLKRNLEFTMSVESENKSAADFLSKISTLNLNEIFFVNTMRVEREINSFLHVNSEAAFIRLRELRDKW